MRHYVKILLRLAIFLFSFSFFFFFLFLSLVLSFFFFFLSFSFAFFFLKMKNFDAAYNINFTINSIYNIIIYNTSFSLSLDSNSVMSRSIQRSTTNSINYTNSFTIACITYITIAIININSMYFTVNTFDILSKINSIRFFMMLNR